MSIVPEKRKSQQRSTSLSDCDSDDEPKIPLNQFYPYIRCGLCCGFLIDASTITECLHTFCKSCIVKHFFYSNRCPTCSIVVHETQPLYNIRPDRQLQDIVYKMVPFLEEFEREQMRNFYKSRGLEVPNPVISSPSPVVSKKQRKEPLPQSIFTIPPELNVSLLLEFAGAEHGINNYKPLERPYLRVSGEATVRHVALFIRRKMELSSTCQIPLTRTPPENRKAGEIFRHATYTCAAVKPTAQVKPQQVDMACGEHLLDHCQSLKDIKKIAGKEAYQDGLLVLHFALVLPSET